jgi:hypothetical protein
MKSQSSVLRNSFNLTSIGKGCIVVYSSILEVVSGNSLLKGLFYWIDRKRSIKVKVRSISTRL